MVPFETVIVPAAELVCVTRLYVQLLPVDRHVIVSVAPFAAAHTPTSVALMKNAMCCAMVSGVSAAKTVLPMAVPPVIWPFE